MDSSNLELRIWLWCAAASALVALTGASLGPVSLGHTSPPTTQGSTVDRVDGTDTSR